MDYAIFLFIGFILGYYFRDSMQFVMLKVKGQYDEFQRKE